MTDPALVQAFSAIIVAVIAAVATIIVAYIQTTKNTGDTASRLLIPEGAKVYRRPKIPVGWIMVFTIAGGSVGYVFGRVITLPTIVSTATLLAPTNTIVITQQGSPKGLGTSLPLASSTIQIACYGWITGGDREMYSVPSDPITRGKVLIIKKATRVWIIGQVKDTGWYKARTENDFGWLRSDSVELDNCTPSTFDVSYLLRYGEDMDRVILNATFSNSWADWVDFSGNPIFSTQRINGEYQLPLGAINGPKIARSKKLPKLSAFQLITSFNRLNASFDSYVGIRLVDDSGEYLATHIFPDCRVEISSTNRLLFKVQVDPGVNTCNDQAEDYLVMSLGPDNELHFRINDSVVKVVAGISAIRDFTIELESLNSIAHFNFLVVTASK